MEGLGVCHERRHNFERLVMTTKVKIEIVQKHMPVVVEVLRSDGTVSQTHSLREIGVAAEEYVHSGQTLRVREMTIEEALNG